MTAGGDPAEAGGPGGDAFPGPIAPMLATSGALPAEDGGWAYEVKWDGVRAIAHARGRRLTLTSRNLLDITPRYPELQPLAAALGRDAVLDGEVVAFDESGKPSFQRLQRRMHVASEGEVRRRMGTTPVVLVVFDVLWLDGRDVTVRPYEERRELLASLELADGCWQVPPHHVGQGAALLEATRAQRLEGIIAKRLGSRYEPGRRSRAWLKVKNQARQEVVVGGWLPGAGNRSGRVGALLVGVHEDVPGGPPRLRYAGRVGTGFTDADLASIAATLAEIARAESPFSDRVPHREARFVEPCLVAEVEFTEWTDAGTLRHPSFKGFRTDVAAADVRREPTPGG